MMGIALVVVFAFLFGAMFLALSFGYSSIEAERAAREADGATIQPWTADAPRFFAHLEPVAPIAPAALSVRDLEEHLRREHAAAAAFVSRPSVACLYPYTAYADSMTRELERHLRNESLETAAFVAAPSVDTLLLNPGGSIGRPAGTVATLGAMPCA